MKIKELISYLERMAPIGYQELYDNSGLIVGHPSDEISKALISLDCTEDVVDEAIKKGCDIIISHHPIVFKGLRKFNGSNYVERTLIKAIKNNIALYAIHTNLDNVLGGVNSKIAEKIGLGSTAILAPKSGTLRKLSVFVPNAHASEVREVLFTAGGGYVGQYDQCSYNTQGIGTFRPLSASNPTIGEIGKQEHVEETKIEIVFPTYKERDVLVAMFASHPYEEVAYDIISLENENRHVGAGIVGRLEEPMDARTFFHLLKTRFNLQVIRHTKLLGRPISRVAICGGAGSFLLSDAKRAGADIFITADYKYHEFFDAEDSIIIADIGHYESEQFTQELLLEVIQKKFANFAVLLTETYTNPINYYYS